MPLGVTAILGTAIGEHASQPDTISRAFSRFTNY